MNKNEELQHYGVLGMKWGRRKGSKQSSAQRKAEKLRRKKEKILRSPTKLYKNRDKFSQEEIDTAMKRFKWERELRSLSRDQISSGSNYANAILGYGTLAVTAYGIVKSPLGQAVKNQVSKHLKK